MKYIVAGLIIIIGILCLIFIKKLSEYIEKKKIHEEIVKGK